MMINILKKLIPFTRLTLNTSLPSEIVMQRLAENIKHVQLLGIALFSSNKRYTGIIEGNTFNLIRFIRYRNSFLPVIKGNVEETCTGSVIKLTITLHPLVIIFILFFMYTALKIAIENLSLIGNGIPSWAYFPLGIVVLLYLFGIASFWYEVREGYDFLDRLFYNDEGH